MLSNEELNEQLFDAARKGDTKVIKVLLEKGADVNAQGKYIARLLHFAARGGHIEVVRLLLKYGANVNAEGRGGTPLYWAVQCKNIKVMRLLLEKGADVNTQKGKSAPLHYAATYGETDAAQFLIGNGADVNAQDLFYQTPLHRAAEGEHIEVVRFLIGNGADVNAQDLFNQTPLHLAAKNGHTDVARFLIGNGADVDAQSVYGIPLYLAIERGNIEVFFLLLLYNAGISAEDRWKINSKPLASCLAEFEQIKGMPHLGGLIEAYKSGDKKAISQYIDNAKNQEALVAKYKGIKERCTNEQLSFVPEYLCDFVKHITLKFLKSHIDEKTMASYLSESKDDIKIIKLQNNKTRAVYELLPKIASEKIVSYSDNDTKENVLLALSKKADVFLNELKNIYQSPNAPLAQPQLEEIDPSAKLQCNL